MTKTRIQSSLLVFILLLFLFSCSQSNEKDLTGGKQGGSGKTQNGVSGTSPSIFWVSDPVQPGEVVMLAGANWGESPRLELSWLQDKKPGQPAAGDAATQKSIVVTPLQVTASSLKFLVPEDWKAGVYSFRVSSGGVSSAAVLVNAPEPWWQQGDWGKEASPGSWLRVFGKCLSLNGKATLAIKGNSKTLILKPTQQDQWSLNVTLPANMVAGEYETWIHNGCGGPAGWKLVGSVVIKEHPPLWKSDVFDIRDFGATGNDEFDDGAAIQSALNAAEKNGGGIVLIPPGLFYINSTLRIPRMVLLRGEGSDRSQLNWSDRIIPLEALIRGTNSFGVEDLTIVAINHLAGIASDPGTTPGAGNVFLHRLNIRLNRFEQLHPNNVADRITPRLLANPNRNMRAIVIDGENIQVTDCNIFSSHSPFRFNGNYGLFSNNRCFQGGSAHFISGTQVIFENNMVEGSQLARGGGNYVRQNLYYAHNRVGNMALGDAELFTSDGHAGKREVTFVSLEGTKATLGEDVEWYRLEGPEWTGNSTHEVVLSIVGGTGYGQFRYLKSFKGREVELESPWDVMPDSTSLISLSRCFKNNLLIDNDFHDGGWVQSYCMGIEWVIAGNRLKRVGGINNIGHGISPSWFNQYINNKIVAGGSLGSPPRGSHLAVYGGVGARFTVFRRNVLHNNSRIATNINRWGAVTGAANDVVIDHNIIRDTDIGISVNGLNNGVLIWRNNFERVKEPIVGLSDGVIMHPAERILNLLSAEGLVPAKLQSAPAWQKALKNLTSLMTMDPASGALLNEVHKIQSELAKAVSTTLSEGQSLTLLQALTGLTFTETSSAELKSVLDGGIGGTSTMSLSASLPEWSIPMTLSLSLPPLPGWQTTPISPVEVKPGGSVTNNITLTIPAGVWGSSTIPLSCRLEGPDWQLSGLGTVQLVSTNKVCEWMVVGPFSSEGIAEWPLSVYAKQEAVWDTLYPPKYLKDININSKYQGSEGMVRWQPVTTANIDFTRLYGSVKNGVACAMTVLRVTKPTRVSISSGTRTAMIYLDGEILTNWVGQRGSSTMSLMLSRTLEAGDHVLLFSVPQTFNPLTKL